MAPPPGQPSLSPSKSTARPFTITTASHHRQAIVQNQPPQQQSSSFNTSLSAIPPLSEPFAGFKTGQQFPPTLLLDDTELLFSKNQQAVQQHTTELLQDFSTDLAPNPTVRSESKITSLGPWNPYDVVTTSMSSQPNQSLSNLQQSKKRPHTDSGYASSRNSRQLLSTATQLQTSFEVGPHYPYDDPLGSATQQKHFLPDQLQQQPPLAGHSPAPPASVAADSVATYTNPESFRCESCDETFSTKSEMTKHMARHTKKYTCDFPNCARGTDGFATKNDLDRHKGSVHHDETVARREYKCCVRGCKDPNKIWERKDNFKAHVKRMHPEQDADSVVEASLIKEQALHANRAVSNAGSRVPDFGYQPYYSASPNHSSYYQNSPVVDGNLNSHFDMRVTRDPWSQEGDLYDAPPTSVPGQQSYPSQLDTRSYANMQQIQSINFLSPTTPRQSNYASSHTVPGQNNVHDAVPTPLSHRGSMVSFPYGHETAGATRPLDTQTLPAMPYSHDEFSTSLLDWNTTTDNSAMADNSLMSAVEPSLGALQSGSWLTSPSQPLTQQADILDQQLHSNLATAPNDQSTSGEVIDSRRAAVVQELIAILKPLSHDHLKFMVDMYQRHPPTHNKDTCRVKSALEAIKEPEKRPFRCTRDGCSKTFTQNNILRKHVKRHDRLFFCTFDGCYSTFGSKDDLRRHELRKHEPQRFEGWRCFSEDVPTSQHKIDCAKFFDDEEKFKQHRRETHHERAEKNNGNLKAIKYCHVHQGGPGHFWCGFCAKVILNEPNGIDGTKRDKFRYDHIDHHVTKEEKKMKDWVDLKSEGLTKMEVKTQNMPQTNTNVNEDSDNEDEGDQPSPQVSVTIGGSGSQVPAPSTQNLEASSTEGRPRKRALSDTDQHAQFPVKTARTSNSQQFARHAPSMARGVSDMPIPGQYTPGSELNHLSRPQAVYVQCCQCRKRRHIGGGSLCGFEGCFHPRCRSCLLWDEAGNNIPLRSPTGHRPGSGA